MAIEWGKKFGHGRAGDRSTARKKQTRDTGTLSFVDVQSLSLGALRLPVVFEEGVEARSEKKS